jgi:hypothetical protein
VLCRSVWLALEVVWSAVSVVRVVHIRSLFP